MSEWEWGLVLAANLCACFVEGGLGFGGSLLFLALTVPWLGWSTSVLTDCLLSGTNLFFTAWLHRRELEVRRVLLPAWTRALLPTLLGTWLFIHLSPPLRVIPLLVVGLILLFLPAPRPSPWFPVFSGFSLGLGNSEAPFGFLFFRHQGKGAGTTALFIATLLFIKAAFLVVLWHRVEVPDWGLLAVALLMGLPATWLGKRMLSRLKPPELQRFTQGLLVLILLLLIFATGWLN